MYVSPLPSTGCAKVELKCDFAKKVSKGLSCYFFLPNDNQWS